MYELLNNLLINGPVWDSEKGGAPTPESNSGAPADNSSEQGGGDDSADTSAQEPAGSSWRDDLVSGISDEGMQKKFRGSLNNVESLSQIGNELHSLRKTVNRPNIPGEDASQEERDAFASQLGWPGAEGKYEYKEPESRPWANDDEYKGVRESFDGLARETRMPAKMHGQVMDHMHKVFGELHEKRMETQEQANTLTRQTLEREWGSDFESNIKLADQHLSKFAKDSGEISDIMNLELQDGRLVGDLLPIVRMAADAGRRLTQEGELVAADLSDDQQKDLQSQIDDITAKAHQDGTYNTPSVQDKLNKLYSKKYGNQPVDGRFI